MRWQRLLRSLPLFVVVLPGLSSAEDETGACCSCAFTQTVEFKANDDIPCSFAYPAQWEVSFDRWENSLLIKAPRCETRCGGARQMSLTVAKRKNNNAEVMEAEAGKFSTAVGSASCGGRKVTFFRPPGTEASGTSGALSFYVGRDDGLSYDARAQFSCKEPGAWQKLERLLIESLK